MSVDKDMKLTFSRVLQLNTLSIMSSCKKQVNSISSSLCLVISACSVLIMMVLYVRLTEPVRTQFFLGTNLAARTVERERTQLDYTCMMNMYMYHIICEKTEHSYSHSLPLSASALDMYCKHTFFTHFRTQQTHF